MIHDDEIAELAALVSYDDDGLDDDPTLADEAKATALLGVYGEVQREIADVRALYAHHRAELERRLAKLEERLSERLEPLEARLAGVAGWLENWHRAQVGEDRKGNPTRLTIHLPTGTLKLRTQQPEVEVFDPPEFMAWAVDNADTAITYPSPPPPPAPRPDKRVVNSLVKDALDNLPDPPPPGQVPVAIPGVAVVVRDRKFTAEPDI